MGYTVARPSDAGIFETQMLGLSRRTVNMGKAMDSISSGRVVSKFSDGNPDTSTILNYQSEIKNVDQYDNTYRNARTRILQMSRTCDELMDIASNFNQRLHSVTTFGINDTTFQSYCQSTLSRVQQVLNVTDSDGRYLFSGSATDVAPVDVSNLPNPTLGGSPSYIYYQGDSQNPSLMLDDKNTSAVNITAGSDCFAQLIYALKVGCVTSPSSDMASLNYQLLQNDALNNASYAIDGLSRSIQELGQQDRVIEGIQESRNEQKLIAQENMAALTDTNLYEAMVRLTEQQVASQIAMSLNRELLDQRWLSEMLR